MRTHIKMALESIGYFQSDSKLDHTELKQLFAIALEDGNLDQDEVEVLKNIISKIKVDEIDDDMRHQIDAVFAAIGGE